MRNVCALRIRAKDNAICRNKILILNDWWPAHASMADDTKPKLELTRKAAKDEGDSKRGKGKKQESRQYIKFYMASNTHLHMTTHTHRETHVRSCTCMHEPLCNIDWICLSFTEIGEGGGRGSPSARLRLSAWHLLNAKASLLLPLPLPLSLLPFLLPLLLLLLLPRLLCLPFARPTCGCIV